MSTKDGKKPRNALASLRDEIDGIDRSIVSLVEQRMRCADAVGKYKAKKGLPVYDPTREQEILDRLTALVSPDVKDDVVQVYRLLFARSRARQQRKLSSSKKTGSGFRILVLNGPNLDLLGIREPDIYGKRDYADLVRYIDETARDVRVQAVCLQSGCEAELVEFIQNARGCYDGIVLNPGAYTHTSVALLDALKAVGLPCVEVHLTDVSSREPFRRVSFVREACVECYAGYGFEGYRMAILRLLRCLPSPD